MPYQSDSQRRYFHANEAALKAQGVDVAEWDRASKGKKLPETVEKKTKMKKQASQTKYADTLFVMLSQHLEKQAQTANVAGTTLDGFDAEQQKEIKSPTPGLPPAGPPNMTPPVRPTAAAPPMATPQSPAAAKGKVTTAAAVETPEEKRKKRLAWTAVGVGTASALGALAIAGPKGHTALTNFSSRLKEFEDGSVDPREMHKDYTILGSRALATPTAPISKIVETYRKSPFSTIPWYPTSGNHYKEFEKGPAFAYLQIAREAADTADTTESAKDLRAKPAGVNSVFNKFKPSEGKVTYPEWLIEPRMNDEGARKGTPRAVEYMKETGITADQMPQGGTQRFDSNLAKIFGEVSNVIGKEDPGWLSSNLPNGFKFMTNEDAVPRLTAALSSTSAKMFGHSDLSKLDHDQQEKLVRGVDAHLKVDNPNEWGAKQLYDAGLGMTRYNASTFYPKYIDKATLARNALLYGGLAAVGAGGAALIHSWLQDKKKEKKPSNVIQMPNYLEKAAAAMVKDAVDGMKMGPMVSSNAGLLRGMGGPPDRFSMSRSGMQRVQNQAYPLKVNKKAEDGSDPGSGMDDVSADFAKIIEREWTSKQPADKAPSTEKAEEPMSTTGTNSEAAVSTMKTAEVDEARAKLPYRTRVEVFAIKDGKIHGGVYKDGGFGAFGGGVDDDAVEDAAIREFQEETGLNVKNIRRLPVEPVKLDWIPPYKSSKQAERAKSYRGSHTIFVAGDLDDSSPKPKAKGDDGKSPLKEHGLYDIDDAIKRCEGNTATEEGVKLISNARIAALKSLKQKTADAAQFLPRKEVLAFTPSGKLILKRTGGRRFDLPSDIDGQPVPYESPVQFIPEGGVPEKGIHGYNISLQSADADLPAGYEEAEPQSVLQDLYAAMGKPENRAYKDVDRARARALLRLLKKRAPKLAAADAWKVSGLVQGALNGSPKDFNLEVEEDFPGDPWVASLGNNKGLSDDEFQNLTKSYSLDPDGNKKPFYFVAKKGATEPVVVFQGKGPMSVEEAKAYGKEVGIDDAQLDFKSKIQ